MYRLLAILVLASSVTVFGQTTTSCGETSQTGIDSGDAQWALGTPCTTGTNSAGYTVSNISYWVGTPTSTSFSLGVYSNASGSPKTLLCSASTGTITPASGWNSIAISGCPTLSASTTYWVGYLTGSDAIEQGTVAGACPGTSYYSTWSNAQLSGVSLTNPFPANTQDTHCYSLYMTLTAASNSSGSLAITTTSLPSGQVGSSYTAALGATGGTTPYSWSLTSGTLPSGLTLNTSTGAITGTPTAAVTATSLTFKVTDSSSPAQSQSATLSLTIAPATLAITTTSLPTGQVGVGYTAALSASGGTTPYSWSLTSGTLPSGLTLNTSTGAITGTPTAAVTATSLTFKVTDSSSPAQTKSATFSLTIAPATLGITTTSLPSGQVGSAYTAMLAASGGTTPYSWSLTSGTLPSGLTLNTSTGAITGTPTVAVTATSLTFKVTDSSSPAQTQSATLSLTVNAATTTTSCGETSQTGIDSGDAQWALGTPCTTGTNSAGYTVSSISYWVGTPTSTSFSLGVYSNASASPSTLLCSASTGTITPASGWNSIAISGCPTLSASTTYWVGYLTGSDAIEQGTVAGACPGTSYYSTWSNAQLSGVSLTNPFPANTQGTQCYSLYMTLSAVAGSPGPLTITTTSLPAGQVGSSYTAALGASGGTTPYSWSLTNGTLPSGLTLNTSTGVISGMPKATVNATSLTFQVTDSSSPVQTKSATFSMTVNASGPISVSLSRQNAGVTINQALSLTATTNDSSGVNWSASGTSCSGSACGTFSSTTSLTGVAVTYTAPATAGVYTITASSVSESSVTAATNVGVTDLVGVTTYHNNLSRNGANTQEYLLNPSNVTTSSFGKLFSCTVDEAIYAQPLWMPNITINSVKHNVVVVATMNDGLYAFDADSNTSPCTPLWHANLLDAAHGGTSGETSVPSGPGNALVGYGNGDIMPEVGVTGTPVIDPTTNTLYVVSKSVIPSGPTFFQRLHAIDLTTGNEKFSGPVNINATFPGSGDGGSTTTFVAREENQRCGLALVNGVVYIAWAAHEDAYPYYGWVVGYSASTLQQVSVLNDDPNAGRGGIWMSGGAPAADSSGNLYLITGNGTFDASSSSTPNNDYGDSFLQLSSTLSPLQYFTPSDQQSDAQNDQDFGAGGAAVLIDLPANGNNPTHLVVGGGKDGSLYVLNRDSLGGYGDANAWQKISLGDGMYSTPAFWNYNLYLAPASSTLQSYALSTSTAKLTRSANASPETFSFLAPTPSVSSMPDNSNGIVWVLDNRNYCTTQAPSCGPSILHAYNPNNLSTEYWNSSQGSGNTGGNAVKFTVPTVANGKVYVGTRGNNAGGADGSTSIPGELDVYGLLH